MRIEHKFGEIKVHGESGREVKISAVIRAQASSHEEAESFAQKIQIEVQQTGEGISIRTIYPSEENKWFHISKHSSWSVNYDIAIPSDAPLNSSAQQLPGSLSSVARVHGQWRSRTALRLAHRARCGPGAFEQFFRQHSARRRRRRRAVVNNKNSSVQVSDVKGTLEVQDRFGGISVRNIQGAATITGGNGTVTLSDAASAKSRATSFGNVDARNIRGDLSVHDNNGNIDISAIAGLSGRQRQLWQRDLY